MDSYVAKAGLYDADAAAIECWLDYLVLCIAVLTMCLGCIASSS